MSISQIVWKGIFPQTMEYCTIEEGRIITVNGHITGLVKEVALHCSYTLMLDEHWNTQAVHIDLVADTKQVSRVYHKKDDGWQDGRGTPIPGLDDCIDIDISLTPFTNTLPINRLRLPEGASKEITVVYFDLPGGTVTPVQQKYTRQGTNAYLYENLASGFTALVETDAKGLVVHYPGIWERM